MSYTILSDCFIAQQQNIIQYYREAKGKSQKQIIHKHPMTASHTIKIIEKETILGRINLELLWIK